MKEYIFNEEGILQIQQIKKCDLAFFYNRTPVAFRNELERAGIFIMSGHKRYYTTTEVEKIFKIFQPITKCDVESAKSRIEQYLLGEKTRNIERFNRKTNC